MKRLCEINETANAAPAIYLAQYQIYNAFHVALYAE
jgi:hypothetical protein